MVTETEAAAGAGGVGAGENGAGGGAHLTTGQSTADTTLSHQEHPAALPVLPLSVLLSCVVCPSWRRSLAA